MMSYVGLSFIIPMTGSDEDIIHVKPLHNSRDTSQIWSHKCLN